MGVLRKAAGIALRRVTLQGVDPWVPDQPSRGAFDTFPETLPRRSRASRVETPEMGLSNMLSLLYLVKSLLAS